MKNETVHQAYQVSDQLWLQLVEDHNNNVFCVNANYMDGMAVFVMHGTEDKSEAERFYEVIKSAYTELVY